jgi:hypothetical protein
MIPIFLLPIGRKVERTVMFFFEPRSGKGLEKCKGNSSEAYELRVF